MKKSVGLKFALAFIVYGAILLTIILTFSQKMTYSALKKQEAQRLYREASIIASDYAEDFYQTSLTLSDFQKQMELVDDYMTAEVWIVDKSGKMLLDSSDASVGKAAAYDTDSARVIDTFNISDFGNRFYSIGTFYGMFDQEMLTVFAPITVSYKVQGYVFLHETMEHVTHTSDGFLNITFYTVCLMFLISVIVIAIVMLSVFGPLHRIGKAARSYAKGDFSREIEVKGNNEITELANTLNYMAREMNKMEDDQRKFVSNVSHDFRSPLTSIKGYVEAMLDGTIPPEFQEKYLNIILFETQRLTKLTQSLLELNQFGSHAIRLEKADFDINQTIRTTIRTFEGTCQKKDLSFDLILTGEKLYVHADPEKIQQVLYNLIDNATKFSNPGTAIRVSTRMKGDKVFVSVKDTGVGIAAANLNKIWERFYKTDASRGKDQKGTGLGLAIVKEIITAHEENINVVSTEGVGTEFTFTLSISSKETWE